MDTWWSRHRWRGEALQTFLQEGGSRVDFLCGSQVPVFQIKGHSFFGNYLTEEIPLPGYESLEILVVSGIPSISLAWKSAFSRTHILRDLDRSGVQEPRSPFQGKEEPRSAGEQKYLLWDSVQTPQVSRARRQERTGARA